MGYLYLHPKWVGENPCGFHARVDDHVITSDSGLHSYAEAFGCGCLKIHPNPKHEPPQIKVISRDCINRSLHVICCQRCEQHLDCR